VLTDHVDARVARSKATGRAFLAFLMWPALAGVWEVRRLMKGHRPVLFVILCAFVGAIVRPTPGSDGEYLIQLMTSGQAGGDPLSFGMAARFARLGLPPTAYFVYVGALYGLFVSVAMRLVQQHVPYMNGLTYPGALFTLAAFANQPVVSALNARYYLAVWMILFCILAVALLRHPLTAVGGAIAAVLTHAGTVMLIGVLAGWMLTLRLGRRQLLVAYAALVVAALIPGEAWVQLAQGAQGWIKYEVLQSTATRNLNRVFSEQSDTGYGGLWFLAWYRTPIFASLLLTGHLILWRSRAKWDTLEVRLWTSVVMMWALMVALRGFIGIGDRVQTVVLALLLFWHAVWFRRHAEHARLVLLITAAPMLFYFVVAYRRWLNGTGTALLLPMPFVGVGDVLPRFSDLIFW
jgi:hypothetical protein